MLCLRVAFQTGSRCSNWGSLAPTPATPDAAAQEVTQGGCGCEVADEPVVVSKALPMKARKGVEEKTGPISSIMFAEVVGCQKHPSLRRGEAYCKRVTPHHASKVTCTSCLTRRGTFSR